MGAIASMSELPVERLVQSFKSLVGRRVSRDPEKTAANQILLGNSLQMFKAHPGIRPLNEILERNEREYCGEMYDDGDGEGNTLLGAGVKFSAGAKGMRDMPLPTDLLEQFSKSYKYHLGKKGAKWSASTKIERSYVYCKAEIKDDIAFSTAYGRARTRASYWVLLEFEEGPKTAPVTRFYVGRVRYYLRLDGTNNTQRIPALRMAVVDLYKADPGRLPGAYVVNMDRKPAYALHALPLSTLGCKLVCAAPDGYLKGLMYFMPYIHYTSR